MSSLSAVITALASRIATGMGSDVIAGRVYGYGKDAIDPPAIAVLPAAGEDFILYDESFESGVSQYTLTVKILLGTQDDRTGQAALLSYLDTTGSTSIRAAIYGDQTLGGTCSYCVVTAAGAFNDVEWANQIYYGAELRVEVHT